MTSGQRATKSQSYFDRYPERRRFAPLYAGAKLADKSSQKDDWAVGSSSKTESAASESRQIEAMGAQNARYSFRDATATQQRPLQNVDEKGHHSQYRHEENQRQVSSHTHRDSVAAALEKFEVQKAVASAARLSSNRCRGERLPRKRSTQTDDPHLNNATAPQLILTPYDGDKLHSTAADGLTTPETWSERRVSKAGQHFDDRGERYATRTSDNVVPSIEEIIRKHSPVAEKTTSLHVEKQCKPPRRNSSLSTSTLSSSTHPDRDSDSDRSSLDSVERELRHTLRLPASSPYRATQATVSPALQAIFGNTQSVRSQAKGRAASLAMSPSLSAPVLLHKKSSPTLLSTPRMPDLTMPDRGSNTGLTAKVRNNRAHHNLPLIPTPMPRSKSTMNLKCSPSCASSSSVAHAQQAPRMPPMPIDYLSPDRSVGRDTSFDGIDGPSSISQYLRSPRLTALMTLRSSRYAGSRVSFSDVGDIDGHAVFLLLGLGAVRHLAGLYDEMAEALGLRIICIDRWGIGKTDDLPAEKRGVLEWSDVIGEVADRLGIHKFSILAHSAGAPYAMGASLILGHRIAGPIHLLAPWVSSAVESGYRWLRYVPDGIIKTAQAAEWRMQGWKLGASTLSPDTSISSVPSDLSVYEGDESHSEHKYDHLGLRRARHHQAPLAASDETRIMQSFDSSLASSLTPDDSIYSSPSPSPSPTTSAECKAQRDLHITSPVHATKQQSSQSPLRPHANRAGSCTDRHGKAKASSSSSHDMSQDFELIRAWHARSHSDAATVQESDEPPPLPPKTPAKSGRLSIRAVSVTSASQNSPTISDSSTHKRRSITPSTDLPTELLRASHAESSGSASDLLVILGRSSQKPWGFSYVDVRHPVLVWHGEKDERVSVSSVLWMEREMGNCRVNIIKNGNHSLMTNVDVVVEALESIVATRF